VSPCWLRAPSRTGVAPHGDGRERDSRQVANGKLPAAPGRNRSRSPRRSEAKSRYGRARPAGERILQQALPSQRQTGPKRRSQPQRADLSSTRNAISPDDVCGGLSDPSPSGGQCGLKTEIKPLPGKAEKRELRKRLGKRQGSARRCFIGAASSCGERHAMRFSSPTETTPGKSPASVRPPGQRPPGHRQARWWRATAPLVEEA